MRRDVSVEMARLLACLSVIGIHTALSVDLSGSYEYGKIFLQCIVTDAVGVFWLIFGCFLAKHSYRRLWTSAVRKIIVPVAVYLAACFYFWDWMTQTAPAGFSLSHPLKDYLLYIRDVITFQPLAKGGGHLWYVYIYLLVALIQPFLKAAAEYLDQSSRHRFWFVLLALGFLLFNDITNNHFGDFSAYSLSILIPACVMVLMGHMLYQKRDFFFQHRKKSMLLSAALFVSLMLLRALVLLYRYETGGPKNKHILGWYTSVGVVCACCILVFCFACFEKKSQPTAARRVICLLASYTFPVYLTHVAVIEFLRQRQIILKLHCAIYERMGGFAGDFLCNAATALLVFCISMLVSVILRFAWSGCGRLLKRMQKKTNAAEGV